MYCLDFCAKYHHEESNRESLSRFIEKLKEKKEVEKERRIREPSSGCDRRIKE
jgi:hypothetical protein